MKFLSSRRRHRAAKPLLLLAALFMIGATYAVVAPATQVSADGGTSTQVQEGKELFAVTCASCHGLNGEGGSQGPSLAGVGAASVDFQVGTGRMPLARPGQQAPRKENLYSDQEIAALAAYVSSMGPGPDIPTAAQYDPEGLSEEELARGGEIFRTNCSACHNVSGNGGALPNGKYAPALHGVAPVHIYEALRTGPQQMPVFSKNTVTDQDVREMIGYLKTLNDQPDFGGLGLGGVGPVGEGLWTWVIGMGALVGFALWIASRGARK